MVTVMVAVNPVPLFLMFAVAMGINHQQGEDNETAHKEDDEAGPVVP